MIDIKRAESIFKSRMGGFSIIKTIPFKGDYYFLAQPEESDEFPTWFCLHSKDLKVTDINPWDDISDIEMFEELASTT